jgi:hypothetical protein
VDEARLALLLEARPDAGCAVTAVSVAHAAQAYARSAAADAARPA